MKTKLTFIIAFSLIFTLCMTSCNIIGAPSETESGVNTVREGMTVEDIDSLQIDYIRYGSYLFLSCNGSNIVARISNDDRSTLENVKTYTAVSPTDSDFEKIEEGMTVHQVVEAVGLPEGSFTHGTKSLYFKTTDGNVFIVYFYNSDTVSMVVRSTENQQ